MSFFNKMSVHHRIHFFSYILRSYNDPFDLAWQQYSPHKLCVSMSPIICLWTNSRSMCLAVHSTCQCGDVVSICLLSPLHRIMFWVANIVVYVRQFNVISLNSAKTITLSQGAFQILSAPPSPGTSRKATERKWRGRGRRVRTWQMNSYIHMLGRC